MPNEQTVAEQDEGLVMGAALAPDEAASAIGDHGGALRAAGVYAAGSALQKAIGFLLLPLYTRALSPAEYGALSVVLAASAVAAIVFSLGLDFAIFRTYFALATEPARQRQMVHSVWRFLLVVPLIAALVLGVVTWPLIGNSGRVTGLDILLALVAVALSVAGSSLPLSLLRAQQRLRAFMVLTGVAAFSTAMLTALFVVALDAGIRGWIVATLLANCVILIAAFAVVPWQRSATYDGPLVSHCVRFSLPLVPHFVSHWALQLADRAVLAGLVSSASLGVYALGAQLALPVLIAVQSLNYGLMPTYAEAGTQDGHAESLAETVVLQVALVCLLCAGGALLAPPLVSVMAPASYGYASSLVGWIVLGYGFLGLYYIPMNGVTLGAGHSRLVWVATATSAALNVLLLFVLVPSGGVRAAAIASAGGYLVLLVLIFAYSKRPGNPVRYQWRRIGRIIGIAAGVYAAATLTAPATGPSGFLVRCAWLLVIPLALAATGDLHPAVLRRTPKRP